LLVGLSKADAGTNFVGALIYEDDIVILVPTAFALRIMHCHDYAKDNLFHLMLANPNGL